MIDMGVASPRAQGQAMMRTATALIRAWARRGSGPQIAQPMKVSTAAADHRRNEPAGDLVGELLDRGAAALRLGDHLHDAGEERL